MKTEKIWQLSILVWQSKFLKSCWVSKITVLFKWYYSLCPGGNSSHYRHSVESCNEEKSSGEKLIVSLENHIHFLLSQGFMLAHPELAQKNTLLEANFPFHVTPDWHLTTRFSKQKENALPREFLSPFHNMQCMFLPLLRTSNKSAIMMGSSYAGLTSQIFL